MAKNFPLLAVWLVSLLFIAGHSESKASETSISPNRGGALTFASQEASSPVSFTHSEMNRIQKVISDLTEEWKSLVQRRAGAAQSKAPAPAQWPAWRAAKDISPQSNQRFLADNANAPGVVMLPDGLQYVIVKKGTGKSPTPNDLVTVTYRGSLIDGTVFDETKPGQPATLPTGELIEGWVEALQVMKEGGEWRLFVPANLGYGEEGDGETIPPNQTLVFDIQLLAVDRPNAPDASHSERTAHIQ
jgi:FKBP-type peptidyl-prolyl cis-trans isomerase